MATRRHSGPTAPGPRPRKALGQHFLVDQSVLDRIVASINVPEGGYVFEIGAGTGQLTGALLEAGHEVVALEVEERMIDHLERRFEGFPGLRIVGGDARDVDLERILPLGRPFAVAGNLPYFAANPIIRHLLESPRQATEIVIMIQREVAKEIVAKEGDSSLLTISVQVYAATERLFDVPPEAFDPPPNVQSTVVRLTPLAVPRVPPGRNRDFFDLVAKTFRNPRKQVHNSLAQATWLPPGGATDALRLIGVEPSRRAETLTIAEWLALLDAVVEVRESA